MGRFPLFCCGRVDWFEEDYKCLVRYERVSYMEIITYDFQMHGDDRGQLIAVEEQKDIPFKVKRVYYMFDTREGVRRGFHSHRTLQQILICVCGSCRILLDDGYEKEEILLDKPYRGLYIGPNIWREMFDFSKDAVLLVLASQYYDEDDYVRDYAGFIASITGAGRGGEK